MVTWDGGENLGHVTVPWDGGGKTWDMLRCLGIGRGRGCRGMGGVWARPPEESKKERKTTTKNKAPGDAGDAEDAGGCGVSGPGPEDE